MGFTFFDRLGRAPEWLRSAWTREFAAAGAALLLGFGVLPLAIFYAGSAVLGRYDNAGASRLYTSVYQGLKTGSAASWLVVFGPYGLYLVYKGLCAWWRASTPARTVVGPGDSSFDRGGR